MKKTKLITTITGLGVLSASIPLTATACSSDHATDVVQAHIESGRLTGNLTFGVAGSSYTHTTQFKATFINVNALPVLSETAKWSATLPTQTAGAVFSFDNNTGTLTVDLSNEAAPATAAIYKTTINVEAKSNSNAKDSIDFYFVVVPQAPAPTNVRIVAPTDEQTGETNPEADHFQLATAGAYSQQSELAGYGSTGFKWGVFNGDNEYLLYDLPIVTPAYIIFPNGKILSPEYTADQGLEFGFTPEFSFDMTTLSFSIQWRSYVDAIDFKFIKWMSGVEEFTVHFVVSDLLGAIYSSPAEGAKPLEFDMRFVLQENPSYNTMSYIDNNTQLTKQVVIPGELDPNCFCAEEVVQSGATHYLVTVPFVNSETGKLEYITLDTSAITSLRLNRCYPALQQSSKCNIGDNFLRGATRLTNLGLSGLGWLTDEKQMVGTSLDNIGIHRDSVHEIGNYFLSGCSSLKFIDMWQLCRLEKIGTNFLDGCTLEGVGLPERYNTTTYKYDVPTLASTTSWTKTPTIAIFYGYNSTSTYSTDSNWTSYMAATCSGSKKIINGVNNAIYKDPTTEETTSIVLSPVTLSKLATTAEGNITFDVFEGTGGQTKEITIPAENLYSLEIGDLLNPSTETKIPDNFLKGCTNLTDIVLDGCTDVTEIGNDFMSGCENLAFFDLISTAPLYQVTKIGDNFMQGCKNLRSVSLYSCGKLQTVGKNFLDSCPTLIQLTLPFGYGNDVQSVYPEPITIGEGAFGNNTFSRVGSTIYACGTNQAEAYKATTNKGWTDRIKEIIKMPSIQEIYGN